MNNADVPIWEKYTLTIEEASKYFRIGENKLRKLAEENPTAGCDQTVSSVTSREEHAYDCTDWEQ